MNQTIAQQVKNGLSPLNIKEKICAAFCRHALIDSDNIFVTTKGKTVLLTGTVRSWTERKDAEDAAWSIQGVVDVENKLEVEGEVYIGE